MEESEHIITLKHYLVLCVTVFACGIFYAVKMNGTAMAGFAVFLGVLLVTALTVFAVIPFVMRRGVRPKKYLILPTVLIAAFLGGMLRVYCCEMFSDLKLRRLAGDSARITGTVVTVPQLTSNGYSYSFELDVCEVSDGKTASPASGKIMMYVSLPKGKDVKYNTKIQSWVDLEAVRGSGSAGAENYCLWLRGKSIFLTGKTKYFSECSNKTVPHSAVGVIKEAGVSVHNAITYAVDRLYPEDEETAAVLKGILVGDKSSFTEQLYTGLSNSGLSHITAVSGMHLSVLFSAINFLFMKLRMKRSIAMIILLPVILLFASAAAFTPSVCRAAVMLAVMITAFLSGERYEPVNSLFLAAGIILFAAPYSLFLPGLVLSFGATLGILVFFRYFRLLFGRCLPNTYFFGFIADSLALSFSSLIGTAYFTALFFGSVSKIQILTNLWVIPVVSFVFCGGYLLCAAYYLFPGLAYGVLRYPLRGALGMIVKTSELFGSERYTLRVHAGAMPAYVPVIYITAAVMLYFLLKLYYDTAAGKE